MIHSEFENEMYKYIGGIIKNQKGILLEINGTQDHVHLLMKIAVTTNIPSLVRKIKSYSSAWVHKKFPSHNYFAWQSGYGVFSVSTSETNKVRKYIQNQKVHHKSYNYETELKNSKKKII